MIGFENDCYGCYDPLHADDALLLGNRAREINIILACIEKYRAAKGHEQRRAALKDVLVMAFHTLQPV